MRMPTERGGERIPADLPSYPSIVHALADTARRVPGRLAYACEGQSLTYAELALPRGANRTYRYLGQLAFSF